MYARNVLFSVAIEYTFLWLILAQDLFDPQTACESTKSINNLYARQQRRLTDLEAKYKEMMRKLDSIEIPQNINRERVAFTAKTKQNSDVQGTIIFEDVVINQGGSYSGTSGKFTAPGNGIYVFSWTIVTGKNDVIGSQLMLNGENVAYGWSDARLSNNTRNDSGSNTITLKLNRGDIVSVDTVARFGDHIRGEGLSSFTGWKIYDL